MSEVINTGAGGVSFDNDEAIGPDEDEDLRNDPIAQIDLKVRLSRRISSFLSEQFADYCL